MLPYEYDIYLSGPITSHGNKKANRRAFAKWSARLREIGMKVFSPPEDELSGWTWEEYLRRDLTFLPLCRVLALLPDWEKSRGAVLERDIAERIGMEVVLVEELEEVNVAK